MTKQQGGDQMDRQISEPGTLVALRQIRSLGSVAPFSIIPVQQRHSTVMPAEDVMAAKVRWAAKAGYRVLSQNVPHEFLPFNAVIRVDERGTEDHDLDYLARFVADTQPGS
jgi:hypothetical protein